MRQIVIIAHDIRSAHNVGALLRTADGLGARVLLTGYTPYPQKDNDSRLPHISRKLTAQIHKTALGAEAETTLWEQHTEVQAVIKTLRDDGFEIVALEQSKKSTPLPSYTPPEKVAILLGREVEGLESQLLGQCDHTLEIPMFGNKESFNVVEAATAALYHCRFYPFWGTISLCLPYRGLKRENKHETTRIYGPSTAILKTS